MNSGKVREAWSRISRWYRQSRGVQDPPTTKALDEVTVERVELYRHRPPEGLRVPLLVRHMDIKDGIPTKAEVTEAVRGLKGSIAGGLSGMLIGYLKGWLREATRNK